MKRAMKKSMVRCLISFIILVALQHLLDVLLIGVGPDGNEGKASRMKDWDVSLKIIEALLLCTEYLPHMVEHTEFNYLIQFGECHDCSYV
jgi:hypothetical protein